MFYHLLGRILSPMIENTLLSSLLEKPFVEGNKFGARYTLKWIISPLLEDLFIDPITKVGNNLYRCLCSQQLTFQKEQISLIMLLGQLYPFNGCATLVVSLMVSFNCVVMSDANSCALIANTGSFSMIESMPMEVFLRLELDS